MCAVILVSPILLDPGTSLAAERGQEKPKLAFFRNWLWPLSYFIYCPTITSPSFRPSVISTWVGVSIPIVIGARRT
jgi:hypothetical protein